MTDPLKHLIEELKRERGISVLEATPVPGAMNNNQLYHLVTAEGVSYAAKFYYADERKRREHEYPFLALLASQGFTDIPHPVYESVTLNCGVYQWIHGIKKRPEAYRTQDMFDLADFIARLHRLDPVTLGKSLPNTHMAVFSMKDLRANTDKRIALIQEDLAQHAFDPKVVVFLDEHRSLKRVQEALHALSTTFGTQVFTYAFPEEHKRISSIDFGPHNTLFDPQGKPTFIDFEYAGLDYPLRPVIDVINHQKTEAISPALKHAFVERYREQAQLPEEIWQWFEPMRRLGLIEWHLLHLAQLRPEKIHQFTFSLAHETFDEAAYIAQKLGLAKRTLEAMDEMREW